MLVHGYIHTVPILNCNLEMARKQEEWQQVKNSHKKVSRINSGASIGTITVEY